MLSPKPKKARTSPSQQKKKTCRRSSDDFVSVARRLECDEDKERFEKKLAKIAKAKIESPKPRQAFPKAMASGHHLPLKRSIAACTSCSDKY